MTDTGKKPTHMPEEYHLQLEALDQAIDTLKAIHERCTEKQLNEIAAFSLKEANKAVIMKCAIGSFLNQIVPWVEAFYEEDEEEIEANPNGWVRSDRFQIAPQVIVPTVTKWADADEKTKHRILSTGPGVSFSYEQNGVEIIEQLVAFEDSDEEH